ncbi:hypothetical protein [Microbacterium arborescens]|uniref:hypothetical protein n=1 Tax=Microbacterium arborescens TaxID=33883 RepID=UPI003C725C79
MIAAVRRFGGLALLPFLSLAIPFVILPVISRGEESAWAAVGIGESVGAVLALVIGYGWPLVGPSRVAALEDSRARELFTMSLVSRSLVAVIAAVPAALLTALLAPGGSAGLAVAAMAAVGVAGLSPSWFLIGRSEPRAIALYDLLPRLAGALLSAALVLAGAPVIWYPVLMLTVTLGGIAWFCARRAARPPRGAVRAGIRSLRDDIQPALAVVAAGVYSAGTVAIVSIAGTTTVVAVYVVADKVLKAALTAIVAATNAVQGWVSEDSDRAVIRARGWRGTYILGGIGIVGALGIGVLGPWATALVFGQRVAIDALTSAGIGATFFAIAVNSAFGRLLLTPLGAIRWVTRSTFVGAAIGVPLIVLGTAVGGAPGAAAAFALSEFLVVAVQVWGYLIVRRADRAASDVRMNDERD